jgi:hypothetical protein
MHSQRATFRPPAIRRFVSSPGDAKSGLFLHRGLCSVSSNVFGKGANTDVFYQCIR